MTNPTAEKKYVAYREDEMRHVPFIYLWKELQRIVPIEEYGAAKDVRIVDGIVISEYYKK